jgi:hypothetical protein
MPALSRQFLHHDAVALNLVQLELDRAAAFASSAFWASTIPRISPLARSIQRASGRFIRPASLRGVSLLVRRRGGMLTK